MPRATFVGLLALAILVLQVIAVCAWRLLSRTRQGTAFDARSFREVNTIAGALAAGAGILVSIGFLVAPGGVAPGVVALIGGAALTSAVLALTTVALRSLLRQAIERYAEADSLRSELREVI